MDGFTITAWGPGGRGVYRIDGPVKPNRLVEELDYWTDDELSHLRRLRTNNYSPVQISAALNRPLSTVYQKISDLESPRGTDAASEYRASLPATAGAAASCAAPDSFGGE